MLKDKNGKICIAKTVYLLTWAACIVKIFVVESPDYSGLALFMGAAGATYFGRSHTKKV